MVSFFAHQRHFVGNEILHFVQNDMLWWNDGWWNDGGSKPPPYILFMPLAPPYVEANDGWCWNDGGREDIAGCEGKRQKGRADDRKGEKVAG